MAQVEEYLRMTNNRGFAVLVVFEDGILRDTVFLAQSLLQQLIRQHTEPLPLFVSELECLLPPLLRYLL